ncbi:MAG: hypothetical protein ATN33_00815 [Epulopiscium sp. Nele67-Bin001]|nr:MAG: hypothetical protein ATN33_00815 [Epulopiscium sp. Nele67-Bin001]
MATKINVSFKDNEQEQNLYHWLQAKLSTSGYIKEELYKIYLQEVNRTLVVKPSVEAQIPNLSPVSPLGYTKHPLTTKTSINAGNFALGDDDD